MSTTLESVIAIVKKETGIDDVKPEMSLEKDIGIDSLDKIQIAMALEEQFNIDIPDDELDRLEHDKISGIADYIDRRITA